MPGGFDRRSFVKACAGIGAASAAAAAGFGMLRPVSDVPVEIVPISYPGVQVLEGSPAPYGMPLIPLEITSDGKLAGIPDAAQDQLDWYKYCAHERAPGTFPDYGGDNLLQYFVAGGESSQERWFSELLGDDVRASDFPASEPNEAFSGFPGVGAPVQWRSEDVPAESTITAIVIKFPRELLTFEARIPAPRAEEIEAAWFPEDPSDPEMIFLATCSFCTHFCCVPGFHTSQLALNSDAGGQIFCTCHLSRYDPFTIQQYNRTIFQFPEAEAQGADNA